ncbi:MULTISPECIES: GNAT family N-acetyltransferase [Vagococcus]|uniref:Acetyltransferase, GNAT family n=1 Tax=Vagococcus fluvialis bH819 TaxID=1255619 RepID=A0A1X6WL42_9ENTE|nr:MULTISPECIES: GNAT family N-acetyltransferase [Vagococcus]SLM84995.1 acetyltransferase, GNAT family [Vagococcus fluvialis bH819]HCM88588.1 GNAT family N-acetyltransferase [Vagococcus sp.]
MRDYQLIMDIKNDEILRNSFNDLAETTFGINFEAWYELGYWQGNYIPYSFVIDNKVIANVSVTKSELVIDQEKYQVIQIGTVMTHKKYQKQGLSRKLMECVLADYQNKCDYIYLFANETVLEFYPKFGFKRLGEVETVINVSEYKTEIDSLEKIIFKEKQEDIERLILERNQGAIRTYYSDNVTLSMFYYSTIFTENTYYIPELEMYVAFEVEGNRLYLMDILTNRDWVLSDVLNYLPIDDVGVVECPFELTGCEGLEMKKELAFIDDDALFVLGKDISSFDGIKIPLIGHV